MRSDGWEKENITDESQLQNSENSELLSMDDRLLARLKNCILSNLENENFGVETLAEEVAFSRSHLYRKIQSLTGQSISTYIRNVKLERAHELILAEVGTISEIAYKVGFGSSTYFTKCFHDLYGYPPGEAKAQHVDELKTTVKASTNQQASERGDASLESLHPTSDSPLIEEIFRAIAEHKPSLQKFLLIDEEEGETLDMRLLAYQTIKSFPWPVGIQLRRLFSAGFRAQDAQRFEQINRTFRNCLKFLLFIACSEVCRLIKAGEEGLSNKRAQDLIEKLERFEDSDLCEILGLLGEYLNQRKEIYVPELKGLYDNSFSRELDAWLELGESSQDPAALAESCTALEQSLMFLLKRIAFLVGYKLVNVSAIKVKKGKYRDPLFEHHFHLLNSADADFRIHEEQLSSFSDSDAVLLMSSIKTTNHILNLEPFVVDTYDEQPDQTKAGRIKRDLYLYAGLRSSKLNYEGSETTGMTDLSTFHLYDTWFNTFQITKELIAKS